MKIIHKNNLQELKLPPPASEVIHIADAIGRDGQEYDVYVGIEKKYFPQIKKFLLKENFVDLQAENQTAFSMVHKQTNALAAVILFAPEKLMMSDENWHRLAWRSYTPFRRRGLTANFLKYAIEIYIKNFPFAKIWTRIPLDRPAKIKLLEELGFEAKSDIAETTSVIFIYRNSLQ
jgi:hypothetical protein